MARAGITLPMFLSRDIPLAVRQTVRFKVELRTDEVEPE